MKIKIKISKNYIFFVLMLVAILEPSYFQTQYKILTTLWRWFFVVCFFLISYLNFRNLNRIKKDQIKDLIVPVLLNVWLVMVTLKKNGTNISALVELLYFIYGFLISSYGFRKDKMQFLRSIRNILFFLYLMNFLSIIIYPNGMYGRLRYDGTYDYRYWFLGFKNGLEKYALVLIIVSALYYSYTKLKKDLLILDGSVFFSIISALKIDSSSSIVTAVSLLIFIWIILSMKKYLPWFLNMKIYGIIIIIFFITVVVTNSLLTNKAIIYLVTKVLGEQITLSGRTLIWNSVFKVIYSSPLTGIGVQSPNYNAELLGITRNTTDAHNFYLEYFMEGGAIGFGLLILLFLQLANRLDAFRDNERSRLLSAGLFILMILFLVENTSIYCIWLYFGLCSYVRYMEQDYTIKGSKKLKKKERSNYEIRIIDIP